MEEKTRLIDTDKTALTMTTEDGRNIRCQIVRIFAINDQKYIILIPEDGSSKGEGYLLRFDLDADGAPVLGNIESDEEYQHASDVFDHLTNTFSFEETPEEES